MIAFTNMPYNELEQIIDYIELMLNKPIHEMLMKQAEDKLEDNKIVSTISMLNVSRGSKSS